MPTSMKQHFLDSYDREHTTTMRVLRAFPESELDLRPHEKSKSARELAWVFAMERGLGTMVVTHNFPEGMQGEMPAPPESWSDLLTTIEESSAGFRSLWCWRPGYVIASVKRSIAVVAVTRNGFSSVSALIVPEIFFPNDRSNRRGSILLMPTCSAP